MRKYLVWAGAEHAIQIRADYHELSHNTSHYCELKLFIRGVAEPTATFIISNGGFHHYEEEQHTI